MLYFCIGVIVGAVLLALLVLFMGGVDTRDDNDL